MSAFKRPTIHAVAHEEQYKAHEQEAQRWLTSGDEQQGRHLNAGVQQHCDQEGSDAEQRDAHEREPQGQRGDQLREDKAQADVLGLDDLPLREGEGEQGARVARRDVLADVRE